MAAVVKDQGIAKAATTSKIGREGGAEEPDQGPGGTAAGRRGKAKA